MNNASNKGITKEQESELKALKRLSEKEIDLSDIPEIRDWKGAVVGKFYSSRDRKDEDVY